MQAITTLRERMRLDREALLAEIEWLAFLAAISDNPVLATILRTTARASRRARAHELLDAMQRHEGGAR